MCLIAGDRGVSLNDSRSLSLKDSRLSASVMLSLSSLSQELPYRMIKSRWLVGTDDLCTVEIMHSSRVSKFWIFFRNFGLGAGYSIG